MLKLAIILLGASLNIVTILEVGKVSLTAMTFTLVAAMGLKTDLTEMKESGFASMFHGFLISVLIVIVALAVQYLLGIM